MPENNAREKTWKFPKPDLPPFPTLPGSPAHEVGFPYADSGSDGELGLLPEDVIQTGRLDNGDNAVTSIPATTRSFQFYRQNPPKMASNDTPEGYTLYDSPVDGRDHPPLVTPNFWRARRFISFTLDGLVAVQKGR